MIQKIVAAIVLLFSWMGLANSSSPNNISITIRADLWCPFNCNSQADKPGYMIEVAKMVFEPLGYKIDYKVMTWTRAVTEVKKGQFNAIVGGSKFSDTGFIYPEESFGQGQYAFYILKEKQWNYSGLKSLESIKLGVVQSYTFPDKALQNYIETNSHNAKNLDVAKGDEGVLANLKKLREGRVDAILEEHNVFSYHIQELGLKQNDFKAAGYLLQKDELSIGFSPVIPESKKYAKILSDGITHLRKTGDLKKILNKYGLVDWKK